MGRIAAMLEQFVARRWPKAAARRLTRQSERGAVKTFARAAARVPAYAKILAERGVAAGAVRDIQSFRALVPLTDKRTLFGSHDLPALCVDGRLDDATAFFTSSGYSGEFSFGVETRGDEARTRRQIDASLEFHLHARTRRTLLINALPMGVRVPAGIAAVFDTGLRSDAALAAVERVGPSFDQILLVGEYPFLKKILEEGVERGLDWKSRHVSLTTGAEVMPENFRRYAGAILGHEAEKPDRGVIAMSLGISEVALSLGQETPAARCIRGAIHRDATLRERVLGASNFAPTLVQYFPDAYFLETVADAAGVGRLVVTTLDPMRRIPLIRYATGDVARVITYAEMTELLTQAGRPELYPELPLPFVAVWGRGRGVRVAGKTIYPEQVKEAIYEDAAAAGAVTGNFRLRGGGDAAEVTLQLRPGRVGPAEVLAKLEAAIGAWAQTPVRVLLVRYEEFGPGMALSYDRKFQYCE